jgi:hypothetical protein
MGKIHAHQVAYQKQRKTAEQAETGGLHKQTTSMNKPCSKLLFRNTPGNHWR